VVGEGEKVFFKVSGTHTVHLTGNYVIPQDDGSASLYDEDEEEEDYDLSPDEDELGALEDMDEESDALDDLEDPRVTELDSGEDEAPKLIKASGKGKNKRPAEDDDSDEENLDDIVAKSLNKEEATPASTDANGEAPKKLTKAEKKRQRKLLKQNNGEAVAVDASTPEAKKEPAQTNGDSEKKVQFAKNLVQGPTPSATPPTKSEAKKDSDKKDTSSATLGVKDVQGVSVDDRKLGQGPAAKKGSRLEMRYIGKLDNGSVFDSNKSGKPFSFKLGAGEVIKGWDIGLQGIQVGGERRLIIPAHLAYGNKALPGIPKNSKLTFDIKCVSVK
jgi:FK506-binding nuclear protein